MRSGQIVAVGSECSAIQSLMYMKAYYIGKHGNMRGKALKRSFQSALTFFLTYLPIHFCRIDLQLLSQENMYVI